MYDVLIIGDSISSGYGVSQSKNWVSIVENSSNCEANVNNLSAQGATSFDALATTNRFYKYNQSRLTIIEIGGNDALRGMDLDKTYGNIESIIHTARQNKSKIILVSVELPNNYGQAYNEEFAKIYTQLSEKYGLIQVHLNYPNDQSLVQEDRIHPSEKGHELIAETLLVPIEKLICSYEKGR